MSHHPLRPRDRPSAAPLANYQRLAIRVIQQALRDLDCASPDLRESARQFLDGGPLLHLWCDVADIPYASTPIAKLASARASVS